MAVGGGVRFCRHFQDDAKRWFDAATHAVHASSPDVHACVHPAHALIRARGVRRRFRTLRRGERRACSIVLSVRHRVRHARLGCRRDGVRSARLEPDGRRPHATDRLPLRPRAVARQHCSSQRPARGRHPRRDQQRPSQRMHVHARVHAHVQLRAQRPPSLASARRAAIRAPCVLHACRYVHVGTYIHAHASMLSVGCR